MQAIAAVRVCKAPSPFYSDAVRRGSRNRDTLACAGERPPHDTPPSSPHTHPPRTHMG
jgi:hypothetical protein